MAMSLNLMILICRGGVLHLQLNLLLTQRVSTTFIMVMKTSSAGETMDVVTIEIFDHFWDRVKFGYAAAEGVVLFIILNVLAISQYVIFRKRLNYD